MSSPVLNNVYARGDGLADHYPACGAGHHVAESNPARAHVDADDERQRQQLYTVVRRAVERVAADDDILRDAVDCKYYGG